MVRQYKLHLDLDGENNKVWDVTNGKVRFYQPSNLGIESTNSIWQSNGVGVMGTRSVVQPQIEFKLETFGDTVQENYELITTFVQDILSQKFVTLEYQTENFQVFADLALSSVTKTEGYGFNGQFSETITFDIITKWYTYEELSLILIENGEVTAKSKIHGGSAQTEPTFNYNLEQHTDMLVNTSNTLVWGIKGGATATMVHETANITGLYGTNNAIRVTQTSSGSSGWRSPQNTNGSISVIAGQKYTMSYWLKNNTSTDIVMTGQIGVSANASQSSPSYPHADFTLPANSGWVKHVQTFTIPTGMNYAWLYVYTASATTSADFSFAGIKFEKGEVATRWAKTQSEQTASPIDNGAGYKYIKNQAYTYYGEYDIERLTRWDISTDVFSIVGKFVPQSGKPEFGVQFLDDIGNEYTAIVMKPETKPDYIMVNTDVNDEYYQAWTGIVSLNLFPTLNFQRYRTREIKKGQMVMVNLTEAQLRIKRKVDFI